MEAGGAVAATLLRFLSWTLLSIAGLLAILLGLRAFDFQDMQTYTQDIASAFICITFAIACRMMANKFNFKSTAAQLQALLEGLDWRRVHERRETRVPVAAS